MPFELGCKWTLEYVLSGLAGGLVAVLILPGCYTTLPRLEWVDGECRIRWGAVARLVVAAIIGCVVDCSPRNAFFGGFFSWHACRWLSEDGWNHLVKLIKKGD
jgi:hypothetical protein